MFDIHIFTLYSLNQTILKEVKKKGKGKGHNIQRIQNAVLCISSQRIDKLHAKSYEHCTHPQFNKICDLSFCTCAFRSPSSS